MPAAKLEIMGKLMTDIQGKSGRIPQKGHEGFTLIELLVVGIIVALAAVHVAQFSDKGDQGAAVAEWDGIQESIETMMFEKRPDDSFGRGHRFVHPRHPEFRRGEWC